MVQSRSKSLMTAESKTTLHISDEELQLLNSIL